MPNGTSYKKPKDPEALAKKAAEMFGIKKYSTKNLLFVGNIKWQKNLKLVIDTMRSLSAKGGGYRLKKAPDQYTVWEILKSAEGDLAPVSCLKSDASPCSRAAECRTLSLWEGYYKTTIDYFSAVTLADLVRGGQDNNYVI